MRYLIIPIVMVLATYQNVCQASNRTFDQYWDAREDLNKGKILNASRKFLDLADAGHAPSIRQVGNMLLEGGLFTIDPALAKQYLERAAALGDPIAQCNLGVMYRDGIGVPVNLERARKHFEDASLTSPSFALHYLQTLHKEGPTFGEMCTARRNPYIDQAPAAISIIGSGFATLVYLGKLIVR